MIYHEQDFYSNFSNAIGYKDKELTKDLLLNEIVDLVVHKKPEVIVIVKKSSISIPVNVTDEQLIDAVIDNLDKKGFVYGLSLLIAKQNKQSLSQHIGADGTSKDTLDTIKTGAEALSSILGFIKDKKEEKAVREAAKKAAKEKLSYKKPGTKVGVYVLVSVAIAAAVATGIYFLMRNKKAVA